MAKSADSAAPTELPSKSEALALLAAVLGVDVGAISVVPPPKDPALAWQERAADYEGAKMYRGPESWRRFIAVTAATGSVQFAARQAGMGLQVINRRRARYPEFDAAVVRAIEYFASAVLERAAVTRAVDGVLEPVFHQGVIRGYVTKYSDTLMTKLLEGNLADKYKTRTEHSLAKGTIRILGGLPPEEPEATTIDNPPQPEQQALIPGQS